MEKGVEHFEKVIFPLFQKIKKIHHYPKEQMSLVTMDTSKGAYSEGILKELCVKKNCGLFIVLHNLANKFQPFNISVHKAAKSFVSKNITWIANGVSNQLKRGTSPCDVKITLQLGIVKPLDAKWIVEL